MLMHIKCPLVSRDHPGGSLFCYIFAIHCAGVCDFMQAICSGVSISFCESVCWEWVYKQLNAGTILPWFKNQQECRALKPLQLCRTLKWLSSSTLYYKHCKWVVCRELFGRTISMEVQKLTQMHKWCIIYLLIAPIKKYDFFFPLE